MTLSPPPYKNLLTIGDCNTFPDHLLPVNQQLAVQIQQQLSAAINHPIQLTNIGQGMYTTREGIARLKDTATIPDYVVINFGLVDAWVTSIPQIYISYYPLTLWRKYPLKWLKMLKKRLRYLKGIIPRGNIIPEAEYIKNIKKLIDICRTRNTGVKIVIWTTPFTGDKPERNFEIKRYNDHLKDIAKKTDCALCDSNAHLDIKDTTNYLDIVHLSGKATKTLGTEIGNLLK